MYLFASCLTCNESSSETHLDFGKNKFYKITINVSLVVVLLDVGYIFIDCFAKVKFCQSCKLNSVKIPICIISGGGGSILLEKLIF